MALIDTKNTPLSQLNCNTTTVTRNNMKSLPSSHSKLMELRASTHSGYKADTEVSRDFSNAGILQLGMICANQTIEENRNANTFCCISLKYCDKQNVKKGIEESEESEGMKKRIRIDGKTDEILSKSQSAHLSNTGNDLNSKSVHAGLMITKPSSKYLQNYRHIPTKLGTWLFNTTLCASDKSNRLACARGIAPVSNGPTFIVADSGKGNLKQFDLSGNLITHMEIVKDTSQKQISQIRQVAVGLDNKCFVTDKTQYVHVFDVASGKFVDRFSIRPLMNNLPNTENIQLSGSDSDTLPQLSGLAIDETNSCLLVGDVRQNLINVCKQDGTRLKTITTVIKPWYLAAKQRLIVISSPIEQTVQVMDQQGRLLHTLHGPDTWMPTGLYCSMDIIYVCNFASDCSGVHEFTITGEYLGCACSEVSDPTGIAFVDGGKKMVVAQWGRGGVRLFTKGLKRD